MGLRKVRCAGLAWCGSAAEALEQHWLWTDVQVEGDFERRCGVRKGEWCGRRSGIAACEENT
jgi:hypothetical protein